MASKEKLNNIVFFDGVCGLCNKFVDFAVRKDKQLSLRYAPLQGKLAAEYLSAAQRESLSTIYFFQGGKIHTKSNAALAIAKCIGGFWGILQVFKIVPRTFRDWVYDQVAKRRYKIFGKMETCRIPSKEEQALFLD